MDADATVQMDDKSNRFDFNFFLVAKKFQDAIKIGFLVMVGWIVTLEHGWANAARRIWRSTRCATRDWRHSIGNSREARKFRPGQTRPGVPARPWGTVNHAHMPIDRYHTVV
jgi:hypothetical protein